MASATTTSILCRLFFLGDAPAPWRLDGDGSERMDKPHVVVGVDLEDFAALIRSYKLGRAVRQIAALSLRSSVDRDACDA